MINPIRWLDSENNVIYSTTLELAVKGEVSEDTMIRVNNLSADDLRECAIYIEPLEGYEDTFNKILAWGDLGYGVILTQGSVENSIAPHWGTAKHPIPLYKNVGLGLLRNGILPSGSIADFLFRVEVPPAINDAAEVLRFNVCFLYN